MRRPSDADIARKAESLDALAMTPADRGTSGSVEEAIGWGLKRFERASQALKRLEQFNLPGTSLTPQIRATEGARSLIVGRRLGLWTLGPFEVTSVTETATSLVVVITTLEGHPLAGSERFELVRHPNGIVRLGIHASSTPSVWWSRLGLPFVRWQQRSYRKATLDHFRRMTGRPSIDR